MVLRIKKLLIFLKLDKIFINFVLLFIIDYANKNKRLSNPEK
jgi:hypothetical protein